MTKSKEIMEFKNVSFGYAEDQLVLDNVSFQLFSGKTYALVGPTGGGKSTTAALMARLYDPTKGTVEFQNKDIRSFDRQALTQEIGFILQDPFLFTGTVFDNLVYGNEHLIKMTQDELMAEIDAQNMSQLISLFDNGLDTEVSDSTENISLGLKQIINFIRIVLRKPKVLILDEATANIDTITEKYLQTILNLLPKSTTKVIIAHRLNTIQNANEIFYISQGKLLPAADFQEAVQLIERK